MTQRVLAWAISAWLVSSAALAVAPIDDSTLHNERQGALIDFRDREGLRDRRPILIAHRGGVVSARSAECSLTAIRLAADAGCDMVELDIQVSRDGIPIVFHDRDLEKACGRAGRVEDLNAAALESIPYQLGDDRIVRLDTALRLCRQLRLGVMLDLKTGREEREFLEKIDRSVSQHELENSTISITGTHAARRFLPHVRFTPTDDEMRRLRDGEQLDLQHRFWFGLPRQLQPGDVSRLKSAGALVLPAINTFRYPADRHFDLARKDVTRLTNKEVDGFQIDSVYLSLFGQDDEGGR